MLGRHEYLDALALNCRMLLAQILHENKVDAQLASPAFQDWSRLHSSFYYSDQNQLVSEVITAQTKGPRSSNLCRLTELLCKPEG